MQTAWRGRVYGVAKKKLELNSTYLQNGPPTLGKILIEQTS
jgi:hypothetical protein